MNLMSKDMFDNLSDRLNIVFKKLKGHGKLTEKNIEEGLRAGWGAIPRPEIHRKKLPNSHFPGWN